ncbi:hypothetical protein NP493_403g00021 [Ridgeia piscesae]|uniref:PCI domain-containing protein n=1 Tax=Ridgeia piscesae TaxID=27915 RepID=A0AAD9L1G7_RIDPI|nr:hypothetical protein NP493_403g00021 [Ridgeia piscesae]
MLATEKQTGLTSNEQFVLLAKSAKGPAVVELIKQVLAAPGVYVFGELLAMPTVQELTTGTSASYLSLLKLFAYGTYNDYKANKDTLPELTPAQVKKLKHLTIVSLANKNKCLPYSLLLQELDLINMRELEDLIIEVIYADVIRGKLDQKNQQLEVDYAIGRDIQPEAVTEIISVLQSWCNSCESVLQTIDSQISKANQYKENQQKLKLQVEQEVANIRKTLKTTQQPQEVDEQMVTDSREVLVPSEKPNKKSSKSKGLRGSGKLWGKSSS